MIFRGAVALIVGLVAAQGGRLLLSPWTVAAPAAPGFIPELHRWHDTLMAAWANILVCGSLLAAAWRPRRTPLPVQYALLAIGIQVILELTPPTWRSWFRPR